MSYILDALGKAEGTRKLENLNELSSEIYRPQSQSGVRKFLRRVAYILIPLICFYLGYMSRPYIDHIEISYGGPSTEQAVAVSEPTTELITPKIVVSDAPVDTVLQEIRKSDKSTSLNSPVLSVISYSEVNTERFAMINGVIINEGDVLDSGEQVLQIDKTSVLLGKGDQSYVLTVN